MAVASKADWTGPNDQPYHAQAPSKSGLLDV
jgi:hypothetical protein